MFDSLRPRHWFEPAVREAGLEDFHWHDLRHTLSTTLRKRGVHPLVISRLLGHSKVDLAMNTYDRVDREDLATALSMRCDPIVTHNENPISPIFIPKGLVSAVGIEPTTY